MAEQLDTQRQGTHRKFMLTKIAAGDWLLPGNDGKTLWRIRLYEDGPTHGMEIPVDRDFWGIWKWTGRPGEDYVDPTSIDHWDFFEGLYDTRREAVNTALRLTGRES